MSAHGDEPVPLGGEARKILNAAAQAERLSPQRKAEMRRRVMAAVAAGAAISVGSAAAAASEGATSASVASGGASAVGATTAVVKAAGLSLITKVGLAVAIATLGAGGYMWSRANAEATGSGAAVAPQGEPATAQQNPSNVGDSSSSQKAMTSAEPSVTAAPTVSAPSTNVSATPLPNAKLPGGGPTASASSSVAATVEPVSADALTAETKLLAAAHAELSKGNAAAALALLDEHAAKFPHGALAPERRAARAMALCKLGKNTDGRNEADALYGADSKSPLAEKIRRACAK